MDIDSDKDNLFNLIREAQNEAACHYVKHQTSFTIGFPEGGDKLHIILIDLKTKKIIKKINLTRLLLSHKSEALLDIFRLSIEKENEPTTPPTEQGQ